MGRICFITGTDTGVGKTVLTCMLVRHLREACVRALAVKPYCSGGRGDARSLYRAQRGGLSMDEINPWHFRAALAPVLAARRKHVHLLKQDVLAFLRRSASRCDVLLVEGAGGLLSPLGEGFDARDLIRELEALPIVVCPDRLGAVNQVRLVVEALSTKVPTTPVVVLMKHAAAGASGRGNKALLSEQLFGNTVLSGPRTDWPEVLDRPRWPSAWLRLVRELSVRIGNGRSS